MAIFHVDYISGSNANDGSAATPYATVKYALETNSLGAGDTVKVAGSGLTTRDSAATYDRNIAYNVLTTSTDLTGSISVNDIVQINPPSATTEFQDWFVSSVTAITATTITLHSELELPGTAATGNWTIKTIDSTYVSSVTTLETWISGAGVGVLIEGGYNNTFTSIIGLTYFRRNISAGAINGSVYATSGYAAQSLNTVTLKNFQFSQFTAPIQTQFGVSIYGTNLRVYLSSSATGLCGTYGQVVSPDSNAADLYFINATTNVGSIIAYVGNFINNGDNIAMNATIYCGIRIPQLSCIINNLTIWNPGNNAHGAYFSSTYGVNIGTDILLTASTTIKGNVAFSSIDSNRSGFTKSLRVFRTVAQSSTLNFKPTAINVIDGGLTTTAWWDFISYEKGFNATICNFILPSGFYLKDQSIGSSTQNQAGAIQAVQVVDDEYTWIGNNSTYIAVDTADFSTGDSSKVFLFGSSSAYAVTAPIPNLFQFTKTATKPTSITIRCKYIANGATMSNVFMVLNNYAAFELPSQNLTATNWTDVTYVFNLTTNQWNLIPIGVPIQIGLRPNSNAGNPILKVDSISVNY
jgi:hypothetical protein